MPFFFFFKKTLLCGGVCARARVCAHVEGRGCANQPEYHHLANIRAEEIKILKVTEQFHQDNHATIN